MFRILRHFPIRLLLLLGLGLPVMGVLAVGSAWISLFGDGSFDVLAPADADLEVFVDGARVAQVAAGENQRVRMAQGKHQIRVGPAGPEHPDQTLEVTSGFDHWFFVDDAERCFCVLEVSEFLYADETVRVREGAPEARFPVIEDRFRGDLPHEVPSGTRFDEEDLPTKIREHEKVRMLVEMPCELLDVPEPVLFAAIGFGDEG